MGEKVKGDNSHTGTSLHTEESQKLVKNQNNERDNNFFGKPLPDEAKTAFLGGGGAVGSVFCKLLQNVFHIHLFCSFPNNVGYFYLEAGQNFQVPAFNG